MEENRDSSNERDNIDTTSENIEEKTSGQTTQESTCAESDRYARYASDQGGVSWSGSSYSGRPVRDSEYSTYDHGYSGQDGASPSATEDQGTVSGSTATQENGAAQTDVQYMGRAVSTGNSAPGSYSTDHGYTFYGSRPGYTQVSAPVMKKVKERKPMPGFVTIGLLAILFGVIAGGTFFGSSLVIKRIAENIQNEERSADEGAATAAAESNAASGEADKLQLTKLADIVDTKPTDVSEAVAKVMPSMVQINCTFLTSSLFGTYESAGAGSGIIIGQTDTELLIATNNHVVEKARTMSVTFKDNTQADAVSKGTDAVADLAVIAIDLSKLSEETLNSISIATIGDSNTVKVGQMAIAIGNAMGYGQSTTVGYISQTEHEVTIDNQVMILLQTDAAINPGNSGGALINLDGEVIGIPSVKFASSSIEGMGFAIPISRAISILKELGSREILQDADKGYVGISMTTISQATSELYNWPVGVYIAKVVEGLPGDKAGLLVGDIITAINGVTVTDSSAAKEIISSYRVGTVVTITVSRQEKGVFNSYDFEVELCQNPEYVKTEPEPQKDITPSNGAKNKT